MKKFILTTTAFMVLVITAFTSCDSRNIRLGNKLVTTINIQSSQDLIDVCDIEVTYKDKGGVDVIDTITSTQWRRIIVNDTFPTQVGLLNYRFLMKPNPQLKKDRCQLELSIAYEDSPMGIGLNHLTQCSQTPIKIDDIASDKVAAYLALKEFEMQKNKESDTFSAHKVILKDGQFEIVDSDFNPDQSNEPSKETER